METFLATFGQIIVHVIEMHGVDARTLLREAGVDPALLRDPDARISSRVADEVFAKAEEHARKSHNMTIIPPSGMSQIEAAIKEKA